MTLEQRAARAVRRLAVVSLAVAAAGLTAAGGATGAPGAEVGVEDERLLLSEPASAPRVVEEWRAHGVDVVRIHARWWTIAPGRYDRRRPAGFDAADPGDRRYDWGDLDRAIALVRRAELRVMLTVTGPGPLWASRNPRLGNPIHDPDPAAFARFARAAADRYGRDVDRYLVWNEPNQPGWLQPQSACVRRACTPVAPHLYRNLVRAAVPAIRAADPGAQVLLGELAPIGKRPVSSRTALRPLTFLRAMGCVDARYRPLARRGPCARFRPAEADAFGYHPHGVLNAPDQPSPNRDEAKLADLPRLTAALDRLTARERLRAPAATGGRFDLYLTEFGYQTSPPDHAVGITLAEQARWLQHAAYIAWEHPRVRNLTSYQWEDEPTHHRRVGSLAYAGWQSGLHFVDGRPKPALEAFSAPFVVDLTPGARSGRAWGQVRPGAAHTVTLERRRPGEAAFTAIAEVASDDSGAWSADVDLNGDEELRFSWPDPAGSAERKLSGVVGLGRDGSRRVRASG